ncbi:Ser/Thr protein phosphatase family [Cordyceps fumosorosea ARSEF 2679]|uniref:Ser/Thr protein phosphatase family n=1 Tax=Cordyceps fumosorosea (strain ARSEF 2679) TaxID=1081104 RepID=A0A162MG19_CORFA|nr:Ser/Thr protein phosphatase family [Cordyceps fumosorosea ARSEF 2679]OAA55620.1 Ser/Thr protein phosphatase family [Cordyceps fumosorosea ARSEF 2679]
MPRLGEAKQPSRRHQRVFTLMLVAILSAACLIGLAHLFTVPMISFRDWALTTTTTTTAQPQRPDGPTEEGAADDVDAQGHRRHRKFDDITMMARLPRAVIPTADNGRRLIIVGDIHGKDDALDQLLAHVGYDAATDHVVAAGDMVNKGPHSDRVVARLMELGASAVRGNHEDRVLLALASDEERDDAADSVPFPGLQKRRTKKRDRKTARQLSAEQVAWLADRPLILAAEELGMYIVHAGLVPGIRPWRQEPWAVMYMRSLIEPPWHLTKQDGDLHDELVIGEDGVDMDEADEVDNDTEDVDGDYGDEADVHASLTVKDLIPVDTHDGHEWAQLWDRHQPLLRKSERRTVVYGHDAKRGLQIGKYTFGLDSGCVKGGHLTALVIHVSKKGNVKRNIRQVSCKKHK